MPPTGRSVAAEIAVQDAAGAQLARDLGADRVELCSGLTLGGLTPSLGLIERAIEVGPAVHVLIRPRSGGFAYTPHEVELILADIHHARAAGAAGVVIGALTPGGWPDLETVERCVGAAAGIEVTFHRAIDVAVDIRRSAELLRGRGIHRLLSSGGAASAVAGRGVLTDLVSICGNELQVQAGAGITPSNVRAVAATGVAAVHFSATHGAGLGRTSGGGARGPGGGGPGGVDSGEMDSGGVDFGEFETTDPDLVAATIAALRS